MLKYKRRSRMFGNREFPAAALIVLEVCAIVAGVLIGFMVNEWRENRNNQKIAEIALTNIASEMAYNHNQIVATFSYYKRVFDQINSLNQIILRCNHGDVRLRIGGMAGSSAADASILFVPDGADDRNHQRLSI
jgi:hypothetical protein